MISYYILYNTANCHANEWWTGSYASILYPNANLTSQRISDFLADIGEEEPIRKFFNQYLSILRCTKSVSNILIDSTGLPNSIRFPLTAVSNHNGEISNEVRLIYVSQQETGLPIFFRYCPGNVVDVSTLTRTIDELKAHGINTKLAILDAGYYSDENIKELYSGKISFVTRMKENRKLYKSLVESHIPDIERKENLIGYNTRYAYIKRVKCELLVGYNAYAYVGLDLERKANESKKLFAKAGAQNLTDGEVFDQLATQGRFVLVSSKRLKTSEILPVYYTRQQIEQVFDIGKNYTNMIPLRVQSEITFRGHLLLTFIATVIIKKLQVSLKNSQYNPHSLFLSMRNQKCKVFEKHILTQEPVKKANDCYKLLGVDCPTQIPL
jgi:transposase